MTKHYNLENIRTLLIKGFNVEELRQFCFLHSNFKLVYNQLSENPSRTEIVNKIIEHSNQQLLFEELLAWAKEKNPGRYKEEGTYYEERQGTGNGEPGPVLPPTVHKSVWKVVAIVATIIIILFLASYNFLQGNVEPTSTSISSFSSIEETPTPPVETATSTEDVSSPSSDFDFGKTIVFEKIPQEGYVRSDWNSYNVELGDLDGDGDTDAFIGSAYKDIPLVWLNNGKGVFQAGDGPIGDQGYKIALEDLDGDKDIDAFEISNSLLYRVFINEGKGDFTQTSQKFGSHDSKAIALGKLNGDDYPDAFIVRCTKQNANWEERTANTVWINDKENLGNFKDTGQRLGTRCSLDVALEDLDGDKDIDAFIANGDTTPFPNVVCKNNGRGSFECEDLPGESDTKSVALGDLDGDEDIDAFVIDKGIYDEGNIWLNDGTGHFIHSGQSLDLRQANSVALADLDNDKDIDAVIVSRNNPNTIWINNGMGHFTKNYQQFGELYSTDVALGYLNEDDKIDVFITNGGGPNQVWINVTK